MTEPQAVPGLDAVIGAVPYRLALAGGWIDQPFVSWCHPRPPGSMVVVGLEPDRHYMERCGLASGTRKVALQLWQGRLPSGDPQALVRALYQAENTAKDEPSGSQDMVGLIYPGVNRLDYHPGTHGGVFPQRIEPCNDPAAVDWLEARLHLLPVCPRPPGYSPLGERHLEPAWVERLGRCGRDCFDAILVRDLVALGAAFNECMHCWETLLPHTMRHPTLSVDLVSLLVYYQRRYPGAMYSGCGGGYLIVASEQPVPGSFTVRIRRGPPLHAGAPPVS